jgi:hypothetical protein
MIRKTLFILFLIVFHTNSFAQRNSTFETWTTAAVSAKAAGFTFNLEEGWRVREFYLGRQMYTDLTVEGKINSFLSAAVGYRLSFKNSYVRYEEVNNRFYINLQLQKKFGDFSIEYRPQLQYSTSTDENDFGLTSQTYFRSKIKAGYKISKEFSLDVGHELFIYMVPANTLINENRISFMGDYKISKKIGLGLGYLLRYYVQVEDPLSIHVVCLDFAYKF